jgi:hypothetical protein
VGFVGEGSIVANRGVGSVTEEWWVSNEIWPWKLGVGEEASSPVRGDLVGDGGVGRVGSWRQGFGLGRNQIHWPHQKFIHVSTNEVYGRRMRMLLWETMRLLNSSQQTHTLPQKLEQKCLLWHMAGHMGYL